MGRRYVVFFEPALANLDAMGNHMATRLENQITDFLDAWRPESAFAKSLQSDLWQFKWSPRNGSGARAFSGYFAGDEHDIALVLVTFKKKNEDKFNLQQTGFNSRAKSLIRTLDSKSPSDIDTWLDDQRNNPERKVLDETDI
ncbi:hypothetical protein [Halolamina sp. C58]|uniref:hypothetical protein n=1 Tax=Halolamina sp. C58 TaxID=3421640 RepID=UPI003EC0D274